MKRDYALRYILEDGEQRFAILSSLRSAKRAARNLMRKQRGMRQAVHVRCTSYRKNFWKKGRSGIIRREFDWRL